MTATLRWTGLLATLIVAAVFPLYAIRESGQQEKLLEEYQLNAVASASDLYAENCVICHGATGEGIAANPPLNS